MQKRGIFFYPYVAARAFLGYGCRFIYEHQTPLRGYWSVGNYRVLPICRPEGFLGIWVSCSTHMSPQGLFRGRVPDLLPTCRPKGFLGIWVSFLLRTSNLPGQVSPQFEFCGRTIGDDCRSFSEGFGFRYLLNVREFFSSFRILNIVFYPYVAHRANSGQLIVHR